MRYPLDGDLVVTGEFKEPAQPGTGLPDPNDGNKKKHIGLDQRAAMGTSVHAPAAGTVTQSYESSAGQTIEARIDGKLWRFMHLSERKVKAGDTFTEGQVIAKSGNSGGVAAHLHVDVRNDNTAWNASLNNYHDMRVVIDEANSGGSNPPVKDGMPAVGDEFRLVPNQNSSYDRTTYVVGTATVKGKITVPAKDDTFIYTNRGVDPKYPGRAVINSKMGGGNNVGLALFYNDGRRIDNWELV